MLNIDDILKRNRENPEPIGIRKIRENILSRFSNLEFIEDGHKYFLHKPDGTKKEMNSVSSICQKFEPEVDWDSILINKAKKIGVSAHELKREWKEKNITSTSNGSLTHLFAEAYMYFFMGKIELMPEIIKKMQYEDGYLIPYGNKQKAVAKYYEDLYEVKNFYPILPETKIYIDSEDNPYKISEDISGTFDALFGYVDSNNNIKLSIRDWKTNKTLFNDFNQVNGNNLLEPFDNFINEPKSVYTIQLSLYQLGLAQLGYRISDRKLLWLTEGGEYQKIDVPDVTGKIINKLAL